MARTGITKPHNNYAPQVPLAVAPNPVTTSAQLSFILSERSKYRINLYDPTGRLLNTIAQGLRNAGIHSLSLSHRLGPNHSCHASGIYLLRLSTDTVSATFRLTIP